MAVNQEAGRPVKPPETIKSCMTQAASLLTQVWNQSPYLPAWFQGREASCICQSAIGEVWLQLTSPHLELCRWYWYADVQQQKGQLHLGSMGECMI